MSKGIKFRTQIWGVDIKKKKMNTEGTLREQLARAHASHRVSKELYKEHSFMYFCLQGKTDEFIFVHTDH